MLPLDGLLVADFSRVVAGPLAAMNLADLGARVVKVERPPAGDDTRAWGPPWRPGSDTAEPDISESTYYLGVNRNKESVQLALDDPVDQPVAHRLADRADILIENFRPGTLERFGLGWEQCADRNPRLVYCSIEGFGDTPAAANLAGYDLLAQAASGLMSITGEADGRDLKTGVAIVEVLAALNATIGVLAAIEARHRTGRGQRVQVSLLDSALAALINQASAHLVAGVTPGRVGNDHPSIAPYTTYRAADRSFVLACGTNDQFAKICATLGSEHLSTDPRFRTNTDRVTNRGELDAALTAAVATRPAHEWVERFNAAGVPAGLVNSIAEGFAFADELDLDPVTVTVRPDGSEIPTVRSPIRLGDIAATDVRTTAPPQLGADDHAIRAWLDSEDELP